MSNVLEYKGFKSKVEFSAEDGLFIGRLIGIDDVVTFEGTTVRKLTANFKEAVDFHIELCEKYDKTPKKSYSGKMFFRVDPKLHSKIAESAAAKGKSINEWGKEVLEKATN